MNAPYATKILKKTGNSVMAYQSTWLVEETFSCNELIIRPRAVLTAPEGKFLTLTVDGVGQKIEPGTYKGDVVLSVTDAYHMRPGGLMRPNQISRDFHTGIVVEDGKVTKTIPAIVQGGSIEDGKVEGVYMASREDNFNGIVVDGEGECTIKDVKPTSTALATTTSSVWAVPSPWWAIPPSRSRTVISPSTASPAAQSMWAAPAPSPSRTPS